MKWGFLNVGEEGSRIYKEQRFAYAARSYLLAPLVKIPTHSITRTNLWFIQSWVGLMCQKSCRLLTPAHLEWVELPTLEHLGWAARQIPALLGWEELQILELRAWEALQTLARLDGVTDVVE